MAEPRKRRKKTLTKEVIYGEAIQIVRGEKQRWETATAFVTDRVSFKMRNLIRTCRKNYFGIFDHPIDPNTNLEKVWYPLTEINVEAVVKNIDLDQKDLNFRARHPNGFGITDIVRNHVKDKLTRMNFGQALDDTERYLAIDGTHVWKTWEERGKLQRCSVDLLNIYIDPTSESIQKAYRFTERSLMYAEEIQGMTGWYNTKDLDKDIPEGTPRVDPLWMKGTSGANSNVKAWDVYETWGKIGKHLITGLEDDRGIEVDGHIVACGIDSPGKEKCLLIEENTKRDREGNAVKPYEEAWYTRVPNRWYGRGVAEKLLTLQIYANIVFNVRINRSRISQMGLFKIRKGSGITPQMLQRLQSNGALVMSNLEDLEQLVVQEVGVTSYKDEDVINAISERLTNAFEIVTGESLPSSTPATNAAIQNQNSKSGFSMIKDGFGMFLIRWMDNHALPILAKELKTDEIVRIAGSEDNFSDLVNRCLIYMAGQALEESMGKGYFPDPAEFQREIENARERLMQGDMFLKIVKQIVTDQIDTEIFVTNEEMDVAVTVQNLLAMLQLAPEFREDIIKQTYDLLGLAQPKKNPVPQGVPGGAGMPPMQPQMGQPQPGQSPMMPGDRQGRILSQARSGVA